MARRRKGSSRRQSKRMGGRRSRRMYKGGDGAADYMLKTVGSAPVQFENVFGAGNNTQSNEIVPLNSSTTLQHSAPVGGQKGGKCGAMVKPMGSSYGGMRRRKGGFLGSMGTVINQAVVPLSILAMQQTYRRNHNHGSRYKGTRRR